MIRKLGLTNFKSHKETQLNLSNLSVLCGRNAIGKSSVFHALLLLRENFLSNTNFDYLDLKSNSVNIGTAKDAIFQSATENEIALDLNTDCNNLHYRFELNNLDLSKTLMSKPEGVTHIADKNVLGRESLFNKNFQFISAARQGPQPYYPKDDVVVGIRNQLSVNEGKAEHFVHFLNTYKNEEILPLLMNSSEKGKDLFYQTIAWEQQISKGIYIVIEDLGDLGYDLRYQFDTESIDGKTDTFKASNVGFGVTYVMPIIIALLSARKDSLILIENPEAHIHPTGQAVLAELICLAAQAGVQIIVETHSDHIINGILVQTKRFENNDKGIDRNNVSIYFVSRNEEDHSSKILSVPIEEGSRIRYPPSGFFDQFTIDRKYLMDF